LSARIQYAVQERAGGIAQALGLTEDFADGEPVAVILGDNIYEYAPDTTGFEDGARIYLTPVKDAHRFGVATLDAYDNVLKIVEKPTEPESDLAVTGFYLYDAHVYDVIKTLKPSSRKELEITDVNNAYVRAGKMDARLIRGWWTDAGTVESLYRASTLVREKR
jgi:glucose-1-phosphate thymidylyltransferase